MKKILPVEPPRFAVTMDIPKMAVIMGTPAVGDYYEMKAPADATETACKMIERYGVGDIPPLTETTAEEFLLRYTGALEEYRKTNLDVMMIPEKNSYDVGGHDDEFHIITSLQHMVYDYSGIDFGEQLEMLVTEYWVLCADAVKYSLQQTEKGREYLEDAYIDMHSRR